MDLAQIRRLVIVAMFSDDELFGKLTLKGGNALNLVYKFGSRSSVDVDFSLEADFVDIADAETRILRALTNRFAEMDYVVFDGKLVPRPALKQKPPDDRFGGYEFSFKIIEREKYDAYVSDVDRSRREAFVVGPVNQRTFKIQISKHEHCAGKREVELDHYTIYVYTPEMLAIEKLRAICQQMPEYAKRGHPVARARDFYDIRTILESTHAVLNAPENLRLISDIFRAKDVDMKLMKNIGDFREFHRPDWPSVQLSVTGELEDFDFYFDFVLQEVKLLEILWVE
jgi:predicted nucleotidyltransferase component of viral defense system